MNKSEKVSKVITWNYLYSEMSLKMSFHVHPDAGEY